VAIVGGGTAGCVTALALPAAFSVLLIEQQSIPRHKSCAGLLARRAVDSLAEMGLRVPSWVYAAPQLPELIAFVDLETGSEVAIPNQQILNIHRDAFDYWLWTESAGTATGLAGVTCLDIAPPTGPGRPVNLRLQCSLTGRQFGASAHAVVVAEGARSRFRARALDRTLPRAITVQQSLSVRRNCARALGARSALIFIVSPKITPLYSWVVAKDDRAILGAAFVGVQRIAQRFEGLRHLACDRLGLQITSARSPEVATCSVTGTRDDVLLSHGAVHFVGEAAGLLDQATGEGISFAVDSARACAQALQAPQGAEHATYSEAAAQVVERLERSMRSSPLSGAGRSQIREYLAEQQRTGGRT
jgi:flavin-dependent dehydrogenase